jgi:hypothetical protein
VTGPGDDAARRMAAQAELAGDLAAVQRWGAAHPEVFAGAWYDNPPGEQPSVPVRIGVAVAAPPGDYPEYADRLRALTEHPDRLVVVAARHSLADLEALQRRIVAEVMTDTADPYVSAVRADLPGNRVVISVSNTDETYGRELAARYGPERVTVEYGVRPTIV